MCGITGFINTDTNVNKEKLHSIISKMTDTISHRGPDDFGVWIDENNSIAFGHRRLSIIDISKAGHQPMVSQCGRYVITFNGEIYNYQAIRKIINDTSDEISWHSNSDTEVILAAISRWGIEGTLKQLVGMFAFAVWDKQSRTLTLARDRFGEKPLYFGWQGNTFMFGSELKALKAHPHFKADIDRSALAAFMQYSYIPAPQSIYQGICKLLPGTFLNFTTDNKHIQQQPITYWSLLNVASNGMQSPFTGSDAEVLAKLEAVLSGAVRCQQISDVPLGAFLSGGIDSSIIVALMQAQSRHPIHTFTIGFDEQRYDEAIYAKAVARHLGTDHTEYYVSSKEARSVIPILPTLYDEPFSDSSQIPTFLVSQLARHSVTVSLSGDAGDELFGGYNRYSWTGRVHRIPFMIRKLISVGITALSPSQWDIVYTFLQPVLPKLLKMRMPGDKAHKFASTLAMSSEREIYQQLISIWANNEELVLGETSGIDGRWDTLANFNSSVHRMMALDAITYLPDDILCKVDRAAMGVSLETRMPFLDHRVVEYAWQLPLKMKIRDGQSKWILRQLLYKYVPKELIDRPKMGFGVPIDSWLRGPLKEWAEGLLNESRLRTEGYLNPVAIRQKWEEHLSGKRNWQYQLWNVLMFEAWLDKE